MGSEPLHHVGIHLLHWTCDLSIHPRGFRSKYLAFNAYVEFFPVRYRCLLSVVVVSMWWTRREQPLRNKSVKSAHEGRYVLINSIWYSANGLAAILGSLMTFGLGHADTGLYPYQLIFIVCGAM
jgi:hypothetical protein